jgi:hypothetical protein
VAIVEQDSDRLIWLDCVVGRKAKARGGIVKQSRAKWTRITSQLHHCLHFGIAPRPLASVDTTSGGEPVHVVIGELSCECTTKKPGFITVTLANPPYLCVYGKINVQVGRLEMQFDSFTKHKWARGR